MQDNELVDRCLELCEQRRWREADELARHGLSVAPDDGQLWQVHGIVGWLGKDWQAAQAALEQATALTPLQPLARCALGDLYLRAGLRESARAIYEAIADDDRFPHNFLPMVASGLGRLGENRLALKVCRRIGSANPQHHAALFGIAFYLGRLGYPVESYVGRLQQAFRLQPGMVAYRLNLAAAYVDLGHIEQAHRLLQDVEPSSIPCGCWLRRARAMLELAGDTARMAACDAELARRQANPDHHTS